MSVLTGRSHLVHAFDFRGLGEPGYRNSLVALESHGPLLV